MLAPLPGRDTYTIKNLLDTHNKQTDYCKLHKGKFHFHYGMNQ